MLVSDTTDIRFTISAFPSVAIILMLLLIAIPVLQQIRRNAFTGMQLFWMVVLSLYTTGVVYFVFFPIEVNIGMYASQNAWYTSINWIPILTVDLPTFVLNVAMFLPFGFLWPLVTGRGYHHWKSIAAASLYASLGLEIMQFIIRQTVGNGRSTDINDLIANTIGGIIGWWLLTGARKIAILQPLLYTSQKTQR